MGQTQIGLIKEYDGVRLCVLCVSQEAVLATDGVHLKEICGWNVSNKEWYMFMKIKRMAIKDGHKVVSNSEYKALKAEHKATEVLAIAEHERMLAEMPESGLVGLVIA
jgi:hypothetical protein